MAVEATGRLLPAELYRRTLDCVHCGLCLSSCPTYVATGSELSSPRGRIYLLRGVAEGRIDLAAVVAEEMQLCLGCRACESACPSGVEYGALLELGRAAVAEAGLLRGWRRRLERWVLRHVIPEPRRLHRLIGLLGLAQRVGLDRAVRPLLPESLREAQDLLPRIPAAQQRGPLPAFTPAESPRRGRVLFFVGCVMPEIFGDVNRASLRVLARNGFDVVVPADQGCCGALSAHAGDLDYARGLARRNLMAFAPESGQTDAIVVNSAGCGAALREMEHWLPGEASATSVRVRDICEWLDEQGLRRPSGSVVARVCYDDPCHLVHAQRVSAAPRRLLAAIDGLELVGHANPGACCGAAGTYNLNQPEMSRRVLSAKLDALAAAAPDVIATGNPGCLLQLRAGVRQRGLGARVVHPIELLDEAYGESR